MGNLANLQSLSASLAASQAETLRLRGANAALLNEVAALKAKVAGLEQQIMDLCAETSETGRLPFEGDVPFDPDFDIDYWEACMGELENWPGYEEEE